MGAFFMSQMEVAGGTGKAGGIAASTLPIPDARPQYNTRLRSVPGIAASFAFSSLAWASSALTSITT